MSKQVVYTLADVVEYAKKRFSDQLNIPLDEIFTQKIGSDKLLVQSLNSQLSLYVDLYKIANEFMLAELQNKKLNS